MKPYRNAALALMCVIAWSAAVAKDGHAPSTDIHNSVSNGNANWNWNHNANRNYNRSANTNQLTNRQGQRQRQHQFQSVDHSGNSASRSSGVGVGVGVGHGGHVQNAGNNTGNSSAALVNANSANGNQTSVQGDVVTYQAPPRAPVSSAIAPSLVSGADTCMGSTSIGAQGVGVGLSFGKTWTDKNCVMLKNSTMLWNMGKADAAIALLCMNPQIRTALEQAGNECPDGRRPQSVTHVINPAPAAAPMQAPAPMPIETFDNMEPAVSARNRKDKG